MILNTVPAYRVNGLKKVFALLCVCLVGTTILKFYFHISLVENGTKKYIVSNDSQLSGNGKHGNLDNTSSVQVYYEKRQHWETSNLGTVLFKNYNDHHYSSKNKTFVILIWKYWGWLKSRHTGGHIDRNPFDECSVSNCIITDNDRNISTADAVVIHVQHGVLPSTRGRRPSQRWVFLSDESPVNTFSMAKKKPNLKQWANIFNWSMTYRSDSDVPVPYGRTVPLANTLALDKPVEPITNMIPYWEDKQKDAVVAALISHCGVPERMNYIKELQKYVDVDVYGKCSEKNLTCPGHFKNDCPTLNKYLFYLAFENTKCRQYLTEKIFYNAYLKGAIPIILGAPREDCDNLLPPYSFLHVDNYKSPKYLAEVIKRLLMKEDTLLMYHQWRRHYELLNEHGFFGTKSYHLCRLCEALNYNDESPKTYDEDDLKLFFEPKLVCNLSNKH